MPIEIFLYFQVDYLSSVFTLRLIESQILKFENENISQNYSKEDINNIYWLFVAT